MKENKAHRGRKIKIKTRTGENERASTNEFEGGKRKKKRQI